MALRAQVSLIFQDEDLYYNFVEQLKQTKQLQSTIIKCLSAYYYNPEVTSLIDGFGKDELESETGITPKESQTIIDEIRNTLAMQSFFTTELENTIEGGTQDVTDILNNATSKAQDKGLYTDTETEYGDGIPQSLLGIEKTGGQSQQTEGKTPSFADIPRDGSTAEQNSRILAILEGLSDKVNQLTERINTLESGEGVGAVNASVATNSVSSASKDEVSTNDVSVNQNSSASDTSDDISDFGDSLGSDEDVVAPPIVEDNSNDATDFMLGLLDSM